MLRREGARQISGGLVFESDPNQLTRRDPSLGTLHDEGELVRVYFSGRHRIEVCGHFLG